MENTYRPATALERCEFNACGFRISEDLTKLINQLHWVGSLDDGAQPEFVKYLIRELMRLKKAVEAHRNYLLTKPRRNYERNQLRDSRLAKSIRMIRYLREVNALRREIDADNRQIRAINKEEQEAANAYKHQE